MHVEYCGGGAIRVRTCDETIYGIWRPNLAETPASVADAGWVPMRLPKKNEWVVVDRKVAGKLAALGFQPMVS